MTVGWVKTHRKVQKWEWYKVEHCFHLFSHMVMNANRKPKFWRGIEIKRGQFVTTLDDLQKETGISLQVIRNRIEKLKKSNEILVAPTNKYTLITIVKYEEYQARKSRATNKSKEGQNPTNKKQPNPPETNKQNEVKPTIKNQPEIFGMSAFQGNDIEDRTNKEQTNQPALNNQKMVKSTLTKEDKKKEVKIKPYIPSRDELPEWLPKDLFLDFVEMRIQKKTAMTEKAVKLAVGKLLAFHKVGWDITAALEDSIMNNWQGFYPKEEKENGKNINRTGKSYSSRTDGNNSGKQGGFGKPASKTAQLANFRAANYARIKGESVEGQPGNEDSNG